MLSTVRILPSAIVRVEPVAGAVIATLLTVVAEATPSVGVVSTGLAENTKDPEPVSSDIILANSAEVVAANCDNGLAVRPTPVVG